MDYKVNSSIKQVHDKFFEPLIGEARINGRVNSIARKLHEEIGSEVPVFLGMLNGAFIYMADLVRAYEGPCEISFVRFQSYAGMESQGELKETLSIDESLKGRVVVLVEDIVDSGNTLHKFLKMLEAIGPQKTIITSLLVKRDAMQHDIPIDFPGFEIGNEFVIGYGLDYNGVGRGIKSIYKHQADAH